MIYRNYLHAGHMCVHQLYKVFYSDNLPKVHICNLQLIISIRPSVIRENFLQPLLLSEVTNVDTTLVYTYILSLFTRRRCPSLVTSNLFFDLGCGKVWFNQINLESMKYPDKCSPDLFDYLSHTKMKMAMLCGWRSCEMSGVDSVFGQREFAFQRGEGREREGRGEKREMAFSTTMMTYLGNDARALNAVAESLTLFRISSPAHAVPFFYAIALTESSLSLSLAMEAQIRVHSLRVISPINVYS